MEKNFYPSFNQGSYSIKLDELIDIIEKVDHIKIDVDGNEGIILTGAIKTLKQKKIKSILIELDETLSDYEFILKNLSSYGYILKSKVASPFHPEIFGSTKNHIFIVSKKKLIIFDFDGVLINSEKNMELTWNKTIKNFKEYNIPFKQYKKNIGLPFKKILENLNIKKKDFYLITDKYKKLSLLSK